MRKYLFIAIALIIGVASSKASNVTVDISAGGLESTLQQIGNKSITKLTIKGFVNSVDIKFIREDTVYLKHLIDLDLGEVELEPDGGRYIRYSHKEYYMTTTNEVKNNDQAWIVDDVDNFIYYSCYLAGAFCNMGLQRVVWPKSLSHVGSYAFENCPYLSEIVLHNGITDIEDGAFNGCFSLTSIHIPDDLHTMSKYAFVGTSLDGGPLEVVDNVVYRGTMAFGIKNDIPEGTELKIREGTKYINNNFVDKAEKGKIASILLPSTLERIGDEAFMNSEINAITIPESVTLLGRSSLAGIKNVTINSKKVSVIQADQTVQWSPFASYKWAITSMGNYREYSCSLEKIVIGTSVESIPDLFFNQCENTEATLTFTERYAKTLEICSRAFYNCKIFQELALPEGTNRIGDYAFASSSFQRIVLPSTVSSFGEYLLDESSIQEIESKNKSPQAISVLTFRQDEGYNVDRIYENATLRVPYGTSSKYKSTNGWKLFSNIMEDLSSVIATSETNPELIEIARSRGWISQTANQMTIENAIAVDDISGAFEGKEIVTFDEFMYFTNITAIPANCFKGCSKLTRITFPEELTSIGEHAFDACDLGSITIPENVRSIGYRAFFDNKKLASVVSLITEPFDVDRSAFEFKYFVNEVIGAIFGWPFTNASLTVPFGTKEAYKSKEGWKEFKNIIEMEYNNALSGDANADGRINGMDIVETVDCILNESFNLAADLYPVGNPDGVVNGMDLVELVDLVLAQDGMQNAPALRNGVGRKAEIALQKTSIDGGLSFGIDSYEKFVMAQLTVTLPEGEMLKDVTTDATHTVAWKQTGKNSYNVVCYSVGNKPFYDNDKMLTFHTTGGTVQVSNVLLSDSDKQEYWGKVNSDATGIEGAEHTASNKNCVVYDLQGRRVISNPASCNRHPALKQGIYIMNHQKVTIK